MKTLYIAYFGALKHLSHSQILPYLRQLASAGIDVTLLSFEERGGEAAHERNAVDSLQVELRAAGIDWRWLRYHKRPSMPATAYDIAVGTTFAAYLVLRKGISVVHARAHVPGVMALVLQALLGVKIVFDLRGLMAEEYVESGRWRLGSVAYRATKWVERMLFRRADVIVMLTRRALVALREQSAELRQSTAHIEVIPCCVDLAKYESTQRGPLRSALGLDGKVAMVYAGSLGGWYLSEELVRLFRIGRSVVDNLHFLVLTQSPHEPLRKVFSEEGMPRESFAIRTVPPKEMPEYLATADFGVHFIRPGLSMIANSPTKFGEYLASGLPILTNAGIGDSDELIGTERVGVLVESFDPASYEQAVRSMQRLLGETTVRARCREVAERRLSLRTVGRRGYLSVYGRLG